MSELPRKYRSADYVGPKSRSPRGKSGNTGDDIGIYSRNDNTAHILRYAVPVLAETLGAKDPSFRSMIGKVGSLTRTASKYINQTDKISYDVFIERSLDTTNSGKKIGRVTLQVIVTHLHMLDESELIAEWPLIEEVGAADDLLTDAVKQHVPGADTTDEIDFDDPVLHAEMMQGQTDYLSELGEDDDETMVAALLGSEVDRYFEKKLRLTTGIRPSLSVHAGYQTDESSYEFKLGDGYSTDLLGDTPAELALMSQLNSESFASIDSEVMQEFVEALEVVGILTRKLKRRRE